MIEAGFVDIQSAATEGVKGLVYSAHHNTILIVPVFDFAAVCQSLAGPPREHAKCCSPKHEKASINEQVEARIETKAAMKYNRRT